MYEISQLNPDITEYKAIHTKITDKTNIKGMNRLIDLKNYGIL